MKPSDKEIFKKRLQLVLSHSGVCSRRRAMELIFQGHVTVNGQVTLEPSTPIDSARDKVCMDGILLQAKSHEYIILNKPAGYVTTLKDRHAAKTVRDLLPKNLRHLYPVGRLDKDTEGLLLLTNDGDAAYKLMHPKFHVDKTYCVGIQGRLKESDKACLEKGVSIDGRTTAPSKMSHVKYVADTTEFQMTIHEGRKRQIRLMLASCGYKVIYLKRIIQGPLTLGNLKIGHWRVLQKEEIAALHHL